MRIIDWSSDVCSSDLSHKWEGDSAYDAHALHGFAHDSIARGSKSFALASQLFDRETRERVWLLYAWCRAADDLTDGRSDARRVGEECVSTCSSRESLSPETPKLVRTK